MLACWIAMQQHSQARPSSQYLVPTCYYVSILIFFQIGHPLFFPPHFFPLCLVRFPVLFCGQGILFLFPRRGPGSVVFCDGTFHFSNFFEIWHPIFPFFPQHFLNSDKVSASLERREPVFLGFKPTFPPDLTSDFFVRLFVRSQIEEMSDLKNEKKDKEKKTSSNKMKRKRTKISGTVVRLL